MGNAFFLNGSNGDGSGISNASFSNDGRVDISRMENANWGLMWVTARTAGW